MHYLLLIYSNESDAEAMNQTQVATLLNDYTDFTKSIVQSGHFKGADRLRPSSTATSIRVRDGKAMSTDGPFAETREQLGGYYLIDAKNLDEAVEIAGRIPTAKYGTIEVRPIWPMGDY